MDLISTVVVPLTTTFTAPSSCFGTPVVALAEQSEPYGTQWFQQAAGDANCFPTAFQLSETSIVYSPGICPTGWTSACGGQATIDNSVQDIVSCCPRSMGCVPLADVNTWGSVYGCVSHYSIDSSYWGTAIKTEAQSVSSMYQRPVMIVSEATTSATPSTPLSTTPSTYTSGLPTETNPSIVDENGLSKGAIAGIAIGAVAGVAAIALVAYIAWVMRKKHRNQTSYEAPEVGYVQATPKPHYSMQSSDLPERS